MGTNKKGAFTLVLTLALGLASCKTTETVAEKPVDSGSTPTDANRLVGTILNTEECGFFIQVIDGDVARSYFPLNLDAAMKVDGTKVRFTYTPSQAGTPEKCPDFIPVNVSDVTRLR